MAGSRLGTHRDSEHDASDLLRGTAVRDRSGPLAHSSLLGACAATAVCTTLLWSGHWLLRALTAGIVTQLVALCGLWLLNSVDGCLGPMDTITPRCALEPSLAWRNLRVTVPNVTALAYLTTAGTSFTVAVLRRGLRFPRRRGLARDLVAAVPDHITRPSKPAGGRAEAVVLSILVLCALALTAVAVDADRAAAATRSSAACSSTPGDRKPMASSP